MRARHKLPAHTYALERLYDDHGSDHVQDVIAPLIAWVSADRATRSKVDFTLDHAPGRAQPVTRSLAIVWDIAALARHDPNVEARAKRIAIGLGALAEKCTEYAGYALALVAISVFLPGRRVLRWQRWSPPDLLFDITPGNLRGVEVAARSTGGWGALRAIANGKGARPGKSAALRAMSDVTEAHLSLWCRSPRVAMMIRAKP